MASSARCRRRSRKEALSPFVPSQSCGMMPTKPEQLVGEAEIVVEHQLPDGADDDAGDQDRQDEDGTIEHSAARDLAAQKCQREADHHLSRDRAEGEDTMVFQMPARNSWSSRAAHGSVSSPAQVRTRLTTRPGSTVWKAGDGKTD